MTLRGILSASAALFVTALSASAAPPNFHKDIEPIFQNRCQSCHRPGEVAPMSLLTYKEVRPWARAIRTAILSGKMPPWSPNPKYGKFTNDLSLSSMEKERIVAWIDAGCPEGNASYAPKPRTFAEGWHIPNPDVVFEMPEPFDVPATGTIDYQFIRVPTNFTEDKWVQMVEVRPGEPSVVHHSIVAINNPGARSEEYLGGYAPGSIPQIWKPGEARLIKAGATLTFQMHYATNGKPASDRTSIGIVFAKEPVIEQIVSAVSIPPGLAIPPGNPNFRVDGVAVIHEDAKLVAMRAHMHLRGKSMMFRAVYPDGSREILLNIPKFDFNWQPYYYLETPKFLPQGTRIETTAYFDNSANNPFNPNPNVTVLWGPQTWDEMMIGWLDIAIERTVKRGSLTMPEDLNR